MATFHPMSGERNCCGSPLSGEAGFAMVMPSDRRTNPARLVHVFLDRRPRFDPEPEPGRFDLHRRFSW